MIFIEFVTILIVCFGGCLFLAMRHVESQLPSQGSKSHPLCWKMKS